MYNHPIDMRRDPSADVPAPAATEPTSTPVAIPRPIYSMVRELPETPAATEHHSTAVVIPGPIYSMVRELPEGTDTYTVPVPVPRGRDDMAGMIAAVLHNAR